MAPVAGLVVRHAENGGDGAPDVSLPCNLIRDRRGPAAGGVDARRRARPRLRGRPVETAAEPRAPRSGAGGASWSSARPDFGPEEMSGAKRAFKGIGAFTRWVLLILVVGVLTATVIAVAIAALVHPRRIERLSRGQATSSAVTT